jgi:hypothetical protein
VQKARGPSDPPIQVISERPRFKPSSTWAKRYDRDERTLMIAACFMKEFSCRLGSYAARRCSSQIAVPRAAAVSATKMPASIPWKAQNRSAGW